MGKGNEEEMAKKRCFKFQRYLNDLNNYSVWRLPFMRTFLTAGKKGEEGKGSRERENEEKR